ncbi:MAG: hypothetical protein U9N51_11425 [Bacteroidota bacterium]|nr:hypothetical protein [Bacteroidota bacterium]
MIGDRIIEVKKFKLFYDGLFYAEFEYFKEKYKIKLYLTPAMLFKILQNEGLEKIDSIQSLDFYNEGVDFFKTTLLFEVFNSEKGRISFLTSEEAELYQDSGYYLTRCVIKGNE